MRKILTLMLVMGIFFTAAPAATARYIPNVGVQVTVCNNTGGKLSDLYALNSEGEWEALLPEFLLNSRADIPWRTNGKIFSIRAVTESGDTFIWEIDGERYDTAYMLPEGEVKGPE
jgi:hypothetical protein